MDVWRALCVTLSCPLRARRTNALSSSAELLDAGQPSALEWHGLNAKLALQSTGLVQKLDVDSLHEEVEFTIADDKRDKLVELAQHSLTHAAVGRRPLRRVVGLAQWMAGPLPQLQPRLLVG